MLIIGHVYKRLTLLKIPQTDDCQRTLIQLRNRQSYSLNKMHLTMKKMEENEAFTDVTIKIIGETKAFSIVSTDP